MSVTPCIMSTNYPVFCQIFLFFFLRIRHPPRSPLFPYPTLFRSRPSDDLDAMSVAAALVQQRRRGLDQPLPHLRRAGVAVPNNRTPDGFQRFVSEPVLARVRSEEHTSELQSLAYLVCRLLLEKKN